MQEREEMKLLQEAQDKRRKEKNDVDIFGSIQQEELIYYGAGGEAKRQKVHVREIEEREAELKKAKFTKEKEAKEKKKLESEEFKRKRKETKELKSCWPFGRKKLGVCMALYLQPKNWVTFIAKILLNLVSEQKI